MLSLHQIKCLVCRGKSRLKSSTSWRVGQIYLTKKVDMPGGGHPGWHGSESLGCSPRLSQFPPPTLLQGRSRIVFSLSKSFLESVLYRTKGSTKVTGWRWRWKFHTSLLFIWSTVSLSLEIRCSTIYVMYLVCFDCTRNGKMKKNKHFCGSDSFRYFALTPSILTAWLRR